MQIVPAINDHAILMSHCPRCNYPDEESKDVKPTFESQKPHYDEVAEVAEPWSAENWSYMPNGYIWPSTMSIHIMPACIISIILLN
jgi:hypothetical protein